MDTWFLRGYLVLAAAVVLLAGVVGVRVDLLSDGGGSRAGSAAQATGVAGAPVVAVAPVTQVPPTAVAMVPPVMVVDEVVDACAGTATPPLLVPPAGSSYAQMYPVWFGDAAQPLAVAPIAMSRGNPDFPESDAYWFAGGALPALWHGAGETLTLSAVRVDGDADERVEFAPSEYLDEMTQVATMDFPAAGCWEVTATGGATEATLVLSVAPLEARPDYVLAATAHLARPYDVPATCAATIWNGPAMYAELGTVLWRIDSPEVTIAHRTAVLWAGDPTTVYFVSDEASLLAGVNGRELGGDARLPAVTRLRSIGTDIGASASLTFPTAGCWEVTPVSASGSMAPVTVYVFPAECRRESDAEPVPTECAAP